MEAEEARQIQHTMKLAQALILRADFQTRRNQLSSRIAAMALVQEGEQPAEDPQTLIEEYERVARDLLFLVVSINRTNGETLVGEQTLATTLVQRDSLAKRHKMYAALADAATARGARYSRSEIKQVATVDVAATRAIMDGLAKTYREIDMNIQQLNWNADLVIEPGAASAEALRRLESTSIAGLGRQSSGGFDPLSDEYAI